MRCLPVLSVLALLVGCGGQQHAAESPPGSEHATVPEVEVAAVEASDEEDPSEDTSAVGQEVRIADDGVLGVIQSCDEGEACDPLGEAAGDIGWGGIGKGGGGIGTGSIGPIGKGGGSGAGGKPGKTPAVQPGVAAPNSSLPKEVIGRVIRLQRDRIRRCYESGLARDPSLVGKLTVRFVIDSEGQVTSAKRESSDLGDPEVERCILGVFRQMRFPKPKSGVVSVRYPLVFSSK